MLHHNVDADHDAEHDAGGLKNVDAAASYYISSAYSVAMHCNA